jgi:lipopolysaccharide exporter
VSAAPQLRTAFLWNTGGLAVQVVVQLSLGLLLARILGPATYGLMAIVWIALTPATILADAGLGLALVQKQELTSAAIRYAFCVQSLVALIVAIGLCALAPPLSRFFAAPDLLEVLVAASSILIVQAFGQTSVNLLRRRLDFRRLQIVQLSALIGSTVLLSLPLALAGFGIWSLVAGALANVAAISFSATAFTPSGAGIRRRTLSMLIALAATVPALLPWFGATVWTIGAAAVINTALVATAIYYAGRGTPWHDLRREGRLGSASFRFLLLNIVNAMIGALPALVIARLFGTATVGLYDRALALIVTPVARAAAAASTVLFSYHADLHRTGRLPTSVFRRSLTMAWLAGLPFAAGVVENKALLIGVTLGREWIGAVPLVLPMAGLTVLILALQVAVPVLNGRGRPEIEIGIQLASIVLFLSAVALVAHDDPPEILWALVAAYGLRVVCILAAVAYFLTIGPFAILLSMVPGAVTGVLVFAANRMLSNTLPPSLSELERLGAMIGISAAILLLAWLLHRALFDRDVVANRPGVGSQTRGHDPSRSKPA